MVDNNQKNFNAAFKAVEDIKDILIEQDFLPLYVRIKRNKLFFLKYLIYMKDMIQDIVSFLTKLEVGSMIVLQIPVRFPVYVLICYLYVLKRKKCRTIGLIHDVEQLRYESRKLFGRMERKIYSLLDDIIVHNDKMKEYFVQQGIEEKRLYSLEIFDYLVEGNLTLRKQTDAKTIVVAGNLSLEKAGYLYKMDNIDSDLRIKLYGPNFYEEEYKSIEYCGKFPAHEIPNIISENDNLFGLVWDGDSIDECNGVTGQYQKYNNPHKLSLYLASGLPVIVWEQAATSEFVKKNNIGILVHSLSEIPEIMKSISKEEMEEMIRAACNIGNKLRKGHYTISVINKIINDEEHEK